MAVWDPEKKQYRQVSLGHTDRERATREAAEMVRLRDAGEWIDSRSLTLGIMVARYLAENTHARDGSLKTEHYRSGCERYAKYLIDWFGADTPVVELTPERMAAYAAARRNGQINGRAVGATAVHQDIKLLKSMMKWATGVYNNGRPLLDRNPLTGFAVPKTRNPIRPMIDTETVEKLMAVAQQCTPGVGTTVQCAQEVESFCCPILVTDANAQATRDYLAALGPYKKMCPMPCPAVVCPSGPGVCKAASAASPASCVRN